MPEQTRTVGYHFHPRKVRAKDGELLEVPEGWELLPPGDAALTRKVKAAGPSWTVQAKKGRRLFSQGVWAPRENIEAARQEVEAMRAAPNYQKKRQQAKARRAKKEATYAQDFEAEVMAFLDFAPRYAELAAKMAQAIQQHATPVGSGTVARTQRIPIEKRAEAAVIAWMRHQTSVYDNMRVPRIKGARREIRRQIAAHSRELLQHYRKGHDIDFAQCPLYQALSDAG